ncbi:hypothetical protein K443DRAFT_179688 [Laccaria amethystina LaAM-08-1]|uniref:Unplaced genomic scaffold K443scaffold_118, whole genome shotgun sequence n=1 Tax=Laccaria amethystina LaAM-08-1 TaxID=1095629 RepID=A0A0C9XNK2_9AGAR|nr:hypothetical protein K443DRAFT_179688 [Laccaria amethystina LaAM-08-1]
MRGRSHALASASVAEVIRHTLYSPEILKSLFVILRGRSSRRSPPLSSEDGSDS